MEDDRPQHPAAADDLLLVLALEVDEEPGELHEQDEGDEHADERDPCSRRARE